MGDLLRLDRSLAPSVSRIQHSLIQTWRTRLRILGAQPQESDSNPQYISCYFPLPAVFFKAKELKIDGCLAKGYGADKICLFLEREVTSVSGRNISHWKKSGKGNQPWQIRIQDL